MISLDTNVVVRAMTQDDPTQARKAAAIMRSGELFVAKTVLIEVECVLRKAYAFPASRIGEGLAAFVGLEGLEVEDRSSVVTALGWYVQGMDFADALHLASSAGATSFATFDAALTKQARKIAARPSVRLA